MQGVSASFNDLVARHALARADKAVATALERLSTGKRINRSSDDPAGLIAADTLGARRKALDTEIKQAEFASHVIGAAEGGLSVIGDLLVELNGLTVASANEGARGRAEREADQQEADSILQAIDFVTRTTVFNGKRVLVEASGFELGGTYHSIAALNLDALGSVTIELPSMTGKHEAGVAGDETEISTSLHLTLGDLAAGKALNLIDGDREGAQQATKGALETVNNLRASLGAMERFTLGSQLSAHRAELENTTDAESQIRDADFATEVTRFFRSQAIQDAGMRVILAVRSQAATGVLTLLG